MANVQAADPPPSSASVLIRPCLEKILQNTTGRKYAKLQDDLESLLERLDILLTGIAPSGPREFARAAPPPLAATDSAAACEALQSEIKVSVDADSTGRVSVNLIPLDAADNGFSLGRIPEFNRAPAVDSGHMPSSPLHTERHPGALADGAARGNHHICFVFPPCLQEQEHHTLIFCVYSI